MTTTENMFAVDATAGKVIIGRSAIMQPESKFDNATVKLSGNIDIARWIRFAKSRKFEVQRVYDGRLKKCMIKNAMFFPADDFKSLRVTGQGKEIIVNNIARIETTVLGLYASLYAEDTQENEYVFVLRGQHRS